MKSRYVFSVVRHPYLLAVLSQRMVPCSTTHFSSPFFFQPLKSFPLKRATGSVDILATLLKSERAIDRLRGFLWRQEVRWPKLDSCLLPASLFKSPGRCSR